MAARPARQPQCPDGVSESTVAASAGVDRHRASQVPAQLAGIAPPPDASADSRNVCLFRLSARSCALAGDRREHLTRRRLRRHSPLAALLERDDAEIVDVQVHATRSGGAVVVLVAALLRGADGDRAWLGGVRACIDR